jgi:hypothetical protein
MSVTVNGALRFADDVTPEDMGCIVSLSYNGMVFIQDEARSALAARINESNGFMGKDLASVKELAKQFPFIKEHIGAFIGDEDADEAAGEADDDVTQINAGTFVL